MSRTIIEILRTLHSNDTWSLDGQMLRTLSKYCKIYSVSINEVWKVISRFYSWLFSIVSHYKWLAIVVHFDNNFGLYYFKLWPCTWRGWCCSTYFVLLDIIDIVEEFSYHVLFIFSNYFINYEMWGIIYHIKLMCI